MNKSLIQLNRENENELQGKKIIFVKWMPKYLDEICEEYPNLKDMFFGVLEDKSAYVNEFEYNNRTLKKYEFDQMEEMPQEAVLLITTAYYKDVFSRLCNKGVPEWIYDKVFYYVNKDTRYYQYYLNEYKNDNLENIIVFRSGPPLNEYVNGLDYGDNARALFEYMINHGYLSKYRLVWFVSNPQRYAEIENISENIEFLPYSAAISDEIEIRERYYYILCHAKYIFFTEANAFCRYHIEGQTRIQLWHGCGFKGSTVTPTKKPNYEYMPVISTLYAELHAKYFGLEANQMLVTGYPKEDWLFHPVDKWRDMLSIPYRKKTIFWLPTFRTTVSQRKKLSEPEIENETGISVLAYTKDVLILNELLSLKDTQLIIKLHPLQDRNKIRISNLSNITLLENDDLIKNKLEINHILGDADALISDYSSAATDYLVLNRPIAFAIDDEGVFAQRRGFLFDDLHKWLPGNILAGFDDMYRFVEEIGDGKDTGEMKRLSIRQKLNEFNDDKGSERLLRTLGIGID